MAVETPINAQQIRRKNGQIIMAAICDMHTPTNLRNIIKYIAATQRTNPAIIKHPIKAILKEGVQLGFLQRNGNGIYDVSGDINVYYMLD